MLLTSLVIASLFSSSAPFRVTDFLKDGIPGTWDDAPPNSATLFLCSQVKPFRSGLLFYDNIYPRRHSSPSGHGYVTCWIPSEEQPHGVLKHLSTLGFTLRLAQPHQWDHALQSIPSISTNKIHTIVVDWQCLRSDKLLQKAAQQLPIMKSPYRWLVLNVTDTDQTEKSCRNLAEKILANDSILAENDADVVLVCRGANALTLIDFWGHGAPTILGYWANKFHSDRRPPVVRRFAAGLNGYVFRTAFVIVNNDSLNHLTDGVDKQHDALTKLNFEVIHVVATMLNSTVLPIFTRQWGYYVNGSWNGLVGLMARKEAEVGGTGTSPSVPRLVVQTPLNFDNPATCAFLFKEQPMSDIYNIFIHPFPPSVWLASIGLLLLGSVLLYIIFHTEKAALVKSVNGPDRTDEQSHISWSDVALLTIGGVCQQGSPIEARGVSGRTVTLFLFFGFLFLYTSYAGNIIALLKSTTSNIYHYKDFLGSSIQLGAHDVAYNRYYISTNMDTYRRRLYLEKLIKYGRRDPFMSMEKGVKKVLNSNFAFFALRTEMYQVISDIYQEHEKCGLREVDYNFLGIPFPHVSSAKWSHNAKFLKIALRKVYERGVRQRQIPRYFTSKPLCVKYGGNFKTISLNDCYGAFMFLITGIGFSVLIFLIERLLALVKRKNQDSTPTVSLVNKHESPAKWFTKRSKIQ